MCVRLEALVYPHTVRSFPCLLALSHQSAYSPLLLQQQVALVKRGTCNFTDKCLRAQEKGAAAVVVYDSQDRER